MKPLYKLQLLLSAFVFFAGFNGYAQVNYVTTVPPLSAGNSQTGITFNVKAINQVTITEIWCSFVSGGTQTVNVWYHPTDSINGAPTVNTTNGWVNLGPVTFTVTTSGAGTLQQIPLTGLNLVLAAGTVHGFHINSTGSVNYSNGTTSGNNVYGDANMYINTGQNVGYGGNPPSFHIRKFNGKIGYTTGPPCPGPTGLNAGNILSTSATVGWNPVSGSVGYDYIVNTSSAIPTVAGTATTATTANVTGLTPSTVYYLHVRNKCTQTNKSPWVTYAFTTLPPCNKPMNFKTNNLMPTYTTIDWDPVPTALSYDYVVDQTPADPAGTTGAVNVLTDSANLTGLTENELYYVHIRSRCLGGGLSEWSLDSFITPIPCRAPQVKIDHVNVHQAVAYWDPVPSALWYEYAITQMSIPPVTGTRYDFTSLHTSALQDGNEYFMHARCYCRSVGVETFSPWGTASFKTWPTNIANANGGEHKLEVYPNPVKDLLTVAFGYNRGKNAMLLVTDVTGKTVRSVAVDKDRLTVDMHELAPGIYMIKYSDDIHTEVARITKQ